MKIHADTRMLEPRDILIILALILVALSLAGMISYYEWKLDSLNTHLSVSQKNYNYSMNDCRDSVDYLSTKLEQRNYEISNLVKIIEYKNETIRQLEENLQTRREKVSELREMDLKGKYHLPSQGEVVKILEETVVDGNNFEQGKYDCNNYAYELMNEFKDKGIYSCTVSLHINNNTGHSLLTTNTTDGVKYIEPQGDIIMDNLKEGNDYCKKVRWICDEEWNITKIDSCYEY